jgi:hypothetical protein
MAANASLQGASAVLRNLSKVLPDLEALYKDIHAHPELSMHETRNGGHRGGQAQESWLRGDDRGGQDGCGWNAPQRRGANGDAPRCRSPRTPACPMSARSQ